MSTNYIRIVPALAAMALLHFSCSRIDEQENGIGEKPSASEVIRYDVAGTVVEGVKSSIDECRELGAITLTSADGSYSLTLTGRAAPTSDCREEAAAEATKAAPVTSTNIESRYNDGSIQILALKDGTSTEYIPQQKLVFASRESGSSTSRWKTVTDYNWPEEALEFWSWAPYSESASAGKISDASVSGGKLTFSYECPSTGETGLDAEAQSDVLLAYSKHSSSDKGNVSLMYKHALSAVCFKVDRANKCTVKSVSLSNVYSKGNCSFDGSSISWSGQSEPKEFTETFNTPIDEYLKDDYANPQGLSTEEGGGDTGKTFLLIPQSATDGNKVTMTLVVRLDGATKDLTLSAELSPSDAIWEAGWTYTYSAEFNKGDYEFRLKDQSQSSLGFVNTSANSSVVSVGIESNKIITGTSSVKQNWKIKSYTINYNTYDVNDVSFVGGGLSVNVNITSKVSALNVQGLARNLVVPKAHDYWVNTSGREDNLDWSPASWASSTIDLSKYDFEKEAAFDTYAEASSKGAFSNPITTANCYIIRHAGDYKFPIVYGNGITDGRVNRRSYWPGYPQTSDEDVKTSATTKVTWANQFRNYNYTMIGTPFIEEDTGFSESLRATVLWQDEADFINSVSISSEATSVIDAEGGSIDKTVKYVNFTVPEDKICQNNALIAVYHDANGNNQYDTGDIIVWSWHIWVTNNPLLIGGPVTVTNLTPMDYSFFPITALGCIDEEFYPSRPDVMITLVQDDSYKELNITVRQAPVFPASFGTYYQSGRKDPLIRKSDPKDLAQGTFTKTSKTQAANIGTGIQNPNKVYSYPTGANTNWTVSRHANLWSGGRVADRNDQSADVFKTIYDPSPARYKLPAIHAFTGFATEYPPSNVTMITDLKKFNVFSTDFHSGFNFYTELGPDNTVNVGGDFIWFSAAGCYNCADTPTMANKGTSGLYWSCFTSVDASDGISNSMSFSFDGSRLHTRRPLPRACGYSARPVKE